MFEKIKSLFKGENNNYTSETTRVHKKQHAKANHSYLVIRHIVGKISYTNFCQIPFGISDDQKKEVEQILWKQLKTKYGL